MCICRHLPAAFFRDFLDFDQGTFYSLQAVEVLQFLQNQYFSAFFEAANTEKPSLRVFRRDHYHLDDKNKPPFDELNLMATSLLRAVDRSYEFDFYGTVDAAFLETQIHRFEHALALAALFAIDELDVCHLLVHIRSMRVGFLVLVFCLKFKRLHDQVVDGQRVTLKRVLSFRLLYVQLKSVGFRPAFPTAHRIIEEFLLHFEKLFSLYHRLRQLVGQQGPQSAVADLIAALRTYQGCFGEYIPYLERQQAQSIEAQNHITQTMQQHLQKPFPALLDSLPLALLDLQQQSFAA